MTAAFAAAASHDMSPKDAMKFAIGVSAASALSPDTGGLDKEVFEQLLPQVQVYTL
jgi:fructose-1-phosphate kinase PfkB-like protein